MCWSKGVRTCSFRMTAVGVIGCDKERGSPHTPPFCSDNSKTDFSRVMYFKKSLFNQSSWFAYGKIVVRLPSFLFHF